MLLLLALCLCQLTWAFNYGPQSHPDDFNDDMWSKPGFQSCSRSPKRPFDDMSSNYRGQSHGGPQEHHFHDDMPPKFSSQSRPGSRSRHFYEDMFDSNSESCPASRKQHFRDEMPKFGPESGPRTQNHQFHNDMPHPESQSHQFHDGMPRPGPQNHQFHDMPHPESQSRQFHDGMPRPGPQNHQFHNDIPHRGSPNHQFHDGMPKYGPKSRSGPQTHQDMPKFGPESRPGSQNGPFHDDMPHFGPESHPRSYNSRIHDEMASEVAFTVTTLSPYSRSGMRKLRFENTITNQGLHWNPNTHEFVCHYPGLYFFTFSAQSSSSQNFRLSLFQNNKPVISRGTAGDDQTRSNSVILKLSHNDRVHMRIEEGGPLNSNHFSKHGYVSFSGFKI